VECVDVSGLAGKGENKMKLRSLINANIRLSKWFDRQFLPSSFVKDGNQDFIFEMAPSYLRQGMKIYDVGGGKQPFVDTNKKSDLCLTVVGIDISQPELDLAPVGAYDETVCADIANVHGLADGDMVLCQAVLEHVQDTEGAMRSIASLLKPGGKALIFVPSRNAVFARLNILLPENIKRKILYGVFPNTRTAQGFHSFYHRCTPDDFIAMAKHNGLAVVESRYYYISSYFSFLFPVYLVWRIWVVLFKSIVGHQAAETFSMVLVKEA